MEDNQDFFDSQTPSSRIKAKIVSVYFPQYCRIISNKRRWEQVRYIDMFAGPGKYRDGNHSTPLLIAQAIAEDSLLKDNVQLTFNDNKYCEELRQNFLQHFPEGTFTHIPRFNNKTVGEDKEINDWLAKPREKLANPHPSVIFFDPFGYKTINTLLLANFLRGWGNELFLFVNSKRINPAMNNVLFEANMKALLPTTFDGLRTELQNTGDTFQRLAIIMSNLSKEFHAALPSPVFTCDFKFQEEDSTATSHYLLHVCKHASGFGLVKKVYSEFDNIGASVEKNGTYTFDAKRTSSESTIAFGDPNVEALRVQLPRRYKGCTLSARQLYDEHQVQTRFNQNHYLKALRILHQEQLIRSEFTDSIDHTEKVFLTKECLLTFPN